MASTIGQFDFTLTRVSDSDVLPLDPFVVIELKGWGRSAGGGAPTISANLMSDREIDEHISALKEDLDAVAARAKRALSAAKQQSASRAARRGDR
jgi:hypothetical protein